MLNQFRVYQPNGPVANAVGESDLFNYFIVKNYVEFYGDQINVTNTDTDVNELTPGQSYEIVRRLMTDIHYRVPALQAAEEYSAAKTTVKLLYLNAPFIFNKEKHVSMNLLLFGNLLNPMVTTALKISGPRTVSFLNANCFTFVTPTHDIT